MDTLPPHFLDFSETRQDGREGADWSLAPPNTDSHHNTVADLSVAGFGGMQYDLQLGSLDFAASGISLEHFGSLDQAQTSHDFNCQPPEAKSSDMQYDGFFLPHGAWRPEEPCASCRRMRLQCFFLQTTEANPNPVTSCSSCVALFRQCSLAERSKRQPHEYETSQPVIGHLHGVNEEEGPTLEEINFYTFGEKSNHVADDAGPSLGAAPPLQPSKRSSSRSVKRTRALRNWFASNTDNPYPTEDEKAFLAGESGMTKAQVNNWFTNARRRRRQSERATSKQSYFPQGSPMPRMSPTAMTPLERWRHSPPEDEAFPFSVIEKALNQLVSGINYALPTQTRRGPHGSASSSISGNSWLHSQQQSADTSSQSASSNGIYQSEDSNSFVFPAPGSVSESGRSSKVVPSPKEVAPKRPVFQCTFCQRRFKKKFDWMRHERSVHMPGLDSWVCSIPLATDQSPLLWRVGHDDPECIYCGQTSPNDEHFQSHEFESCAERSANERIFNRKDHLWQHLYKFHGCRKWEGWTPNLGTLQVSLDEVRTRCGFCDATLETWTQRERHLANHFRCGLSMAQWMGNGNGGVEDVGLVKGGIRP